MFRAFFALVMIVTLTVACLPTPALAAPTQADAGVSIYLVKLVALAEGAWERFEWFIGKQGMTVDPNGNPIPPKTPIADPGTDESSLDDSKG